VEIPVDHISHVESRMTVVGSQQGFDSEDQRLNRFPQAGNIADYSRILNGLGMTAELVQKACHLLELVQKPC